ncbi:MAG: hypothetical protein K0S45_3693, partial [Nitrospira sp.]|nr:hypothetical protein [Nitrospira sp.]
MKQGMSRRSGVRARRKTAIGLIVLCMNVSSYLTTHADMPMLVVQALDLSTDTPAVQFSIAPQSLTDALHDFAATTGLQVSYEAPLASGLTSPGVSGSRTPKDALKT